MFHQFMETLLNIIFIYHHIKKIHDISTVGIVLLVIVLDMNPFYIYECKSNASKKSKGFTTKKKKKQKSVSMLKSNKGLCRIKTNIDVQ